MTAPDEPGPAGADDPSAGKTAPVTAASNPGNGEAGERQAADIDASAGAPLNPEGGKPSASVNDFSSFAGIPGANPDSSADAGPAMATPAANSDGHEPHAACTEMSLLLQADIDNELPAADAARVAAHLANCPRCTAEQARILHLSQRLRAELPPYKIPPALQKTIRDRIAATAVTTPPRFAFPQSRPASFGAGFAVAAALALFAILPRAFAPTAAPTLAAAIVDAHVHALQPGHLIDITSSDRHTVKPWFDGKVPFAPSVIDFADKGFPLAGGRLDYVDNHAAAALVYRRRLHVINVFVWPVASAADKLALDGARHGYTAVHWSAGGLNYWAVSDLNARDLRSFVELFRARLAKEG